MKLLICTPYSLRRELGAPKIVIELAEELRLLGWECTLVGKEEIEPSGSGTPYPAALRDYLLAHAGRYDIVEYDHQALPFPRALFPASPLLVARSSLLAHHFRTIQIPPMERGWAALRERLARLRDWPDHRRRIARAQTTVLQADLVNVANRGDRDELIRCGLPAGKIAILPYGIDAARRPLFDAIDPAPPREPRVAFVGSFDARKGGRDFPALVAALVRETPALRVRLLGTSETRPDGGPIVDFFPPALRPHLEIVPRYAPDELPALLADCSVGLFPSYIESFGFGVIEMLAAAVPVIAYDCPGPTDILPPEQIVPAGDFHAMAARVTALLRNPETLRTARLAAREGSREYRWDRIARATAEAYAEAWEKRQSGFPKTMAAKESVS